MRLRLRSPLASRRPARQKQPSLTAPEDVTPDYLPFSLSPEVGTTGAGGTAAWRFSNHFGLAAGGDYFSHTLLNNRTINGVSYSGDFTLQSETGAQILSVKDKFVLRLCRRIVQPKRGERIGIRNGDN